ncbi:hypothetical protein [Candidatus Enterococcus ferrettii]|uniref:Alternate signal-mediated exported protein n=1 Tax=Candidatus Enterococcus ferrettii TaxID=2815324 RepID=A0ABV0ET58_9ENTE|nr:hypothetical protein [Enterococcus sp. 665A]MBO1340196.1 hypothetical protein [Enterococcus sp. 665A]
MKKNSKKKKLMAAAAVLALIAAISGTFAWITAQDQRINRAESAAVNDDSVVLKEQWEPMPLVAGTEAKKEVSVSNTGNANVFVRISYEEVLKHLAEKGSIEYGAVTEAGAKYAYVANDSGLGKNMPVNANAASMFNDGYRIVPASQVTGLTSQDTNVKLLAKGGKVVDPLTGSVSNNLETKIIHEYYTDPSNTGKNPGDAGYDATKNKYQAMTYDIAVTDEKSSNDGTAWDYTLSNVKYAYYKNGYKNTVANWAKSTLPDESGTTTGNALLGTKGLRYSVNYNYTTTAEGLGASATIPGPTPATTADQKPIASSTNYGLEADTNGLGKSHIRVGYGTDITDIATLASKNWVYNADDGWFYYTVPLKSGETTPDLLKKLVFESALGVEYTNASFDLVVKMEAVQATEAALTDSAGWNLGGGSKPTGDTLAIVTKLVAGI